MAKLHTPGPYVLWDDGRTIGIDSVDLDEAGETYPISLCEVVDYGDMADPALLAGDQEFIFRAMTHYYKLLVELKACADFLESAGFDATPAREAIAKAEGRL